MCYLILLQQPWYKGFTGTIVHTEPQRYLMYGNVARLNTTTIEITELPIGCWTQTYKENVLKPMLHERNRESTAVYHVRNCITVT